VVMNTAIQLRSLSHKASMPVGMTWGIPWREGELRRDEALQLHRHNDGTAIPMQSWATAYWPDGSVKWTAHAAADLAGGTDAFSLMKGEAAAPEQTVTVRQTDETVQLDTGVMVCTLGKRGSRWLRSIVRGGIEVCSGGELVCLKESRSEASGVRTTREEPFESRVHRITVEQEGPVRAVVKIEGRHRAAAGGSREWLPFSMRLYVYAGLETIRIVHTFYFDGNPNEDYIKGLGVRFTIPMRGVHYNRHVRFAGDSGIFSESPKTLHTRRTKGSIVSCSSSRRQAARSLSTRRRMLTS
jgi:hypothetical protein